MSDVGNKWTITFTEKDLENVRLPHCNALVVTVRIGRCHTHRVLVDQGSSTDIMYYSLFKKMGLTDADLTPVKSLLVEFTGAPVWLIGKISLPVIAGSKTITLNFSVLNAPGPYNAILGRGWIHKMQAIASTYHQVVRFIGISDQEDLMGEQISAKACFVSAINRSPKFGRVNWVEVTEGPLAEEVGRKAEEKSVEELISVPICEGTDRFFLVGFGLNGKDRLAMINFLKYNLEVFAWTPKEMSGIDPKFISHHLNDVSMSYDIIHFMFD